MPRIQITQRLHGIFQLKHLSLKLQFQHFLTEVSFQYQTLPQERIYQK